MNIVYKSCNWIRPILEYGSIHYSGAATTYLHRLDNLQSRIEQTCSFVLQTPLSPECCNCGFGLSFIGWKGPWELTDLLPAVL